MSESAILLEELFLENALDEIFHGGPKVPLLDKLLAHMAEGALPGSQAGRRHPGRVATAFRRVAVPLLAAGCLVAAIVIIPPKQTTTVAPPPGVVASDDARFSIDAASGDMHIDLGWVLAFDGAPRLGASGHSVESIHGRVLIVAGPTPTEAELRARGPWLIENGVKEEEMETPKWIRAGSLAIWLIIGTAIVDGQILSAQAAGTLDPTFGNAGVVLQSTQPSIIFMDSVVQPDGKVVAAGRDFGPSSGDIVVVRYHPNGVPDATFGPGSSGLVRVTMHSQTALGAMVALAPDGRIAVLSVGRNVVVCLKPDGSRDSRFSSGGVKDLNTLFRWGRSDLPDSWNARSIVFQSNGRMAIAGFGMYSGNQRDVAVMRLTDRGRVDKDFGNSGLARVDVAASNDSPLSQGAIHVDAQNRITMGVMAIQSGQPVQFNILRLTASGQVDTSFGTLAGSQRTGMVAVPMPNMNRIAAGPMSSVYAIGTGGAQSQSVYVAGFDSSGDPVMSFGTAGVVQIPKWTGRANDYITRTVATFDSYGRFVFCATMRDNLGGGVLQSEAYLVRLNSNGSVDTTYGTGGVSQVLTVHQSTTATTTLNISNVNIDGIGRAIVTGEAWRDGGGSAADVVGVVAAFHG